MVKKGKAILTLIFCRYPERVFQSRLMAVKYTTIKSEIIPTPINASRFRRLRSIFS